jgi:hypothetical protein
MIASISLLKTMHEAKRANALRTGKHVNFSAISWDAGYHGGR